MEYNEKMNLPMPSSKPPPASIEGGKAVCASYYWDGKETSGQTATVLFQSDEKLSLLR